MLVENWADLGAGGGKRSIRSVGLAPQGQL
jgi:hypothetical protein